jgi:hypothetical protein
MRAYQIIGQRESIGTKDEAKMRLPYIILFGKGLDGDRSATAGGSVLGGDEKKERDRERRRF